MRPDLVVRAKRGAAIALGALGALAAASACSSAEETPRVEVRDAEPVDPGEPGEPIEPDPEPKPPGDAGAPDAEEPCTTKVVINELMTLGTAPNDEFIELYNPNPCAVAMGGHRLRYKSAAGMEPTGALLHTFGAGTSIAARGFYVVGTTAFTGPKDETFNGGGVTPNGGMANDGQVALFDGADQKIDGLGYGSATGDYVEGTAAPKPQPKGSIGRKQDGVDTDDNVKDFDILLPKPNPGAPNNP
jgi:hypothetical protein